MTREEEIRKAAYEYACGVASAGFCVEEYTIEDFTKGAEWADKSIIDKAWNWFTEQKGERTIDDFRKAMEE